MGGPSKLSILGSDALELNFVLLEDLSNFFVFIADQSQFLLFDLFDLLLVASLGVRLFDFPVPEFFYLFGQFLLLLVEPLLEILFFLVDQLYLLVHFLVVLVVLDVETIVELLDFPLFFFLHLPHPAFVLVQFAS